MLSVNNNLHTNIEKNLIQLRVKIKSGTRYTGPAFCPYAVAQRVKS
jgi:hypothetical protein